MPMVSKDLLMKSGLTNLGSINARKNPMRNPKMKLATFSLLMILASMGVLFSVNAHSDVSALWACKGVTVDVSGPKSITVGGRLDYEIRIHNSSDCELSDSSVVDFIPRMSTFSHASPQPTEYPSTHNGTDPIEHPVSKIEWKNVSLGAGKDIEFQITAHVKSPDDRILLNSVCFENSQTGRICSQVETNVLKQP
jgi:hypothetical protein